MTDGLHIMNVINVQTVTAQRVEAEYRVCNDKRKEERGMNCHHHHYYYYYYYYYYNYYVFSWRKGPYWTRVSSL